MSFLKILVKIRRTGKLSDNFFLRVRSLFQKSTLPFLAENRTRSFQKIPVQKYSKTQN